MGKLFKKINDVRITADSALIWYITWLIQMIICGTWFCVEKKLKYTHIQSSAHFQWSEQKYFEINC